MHDEPDAERGMIACPCCNKEYNELYWGWIELSRQAPLLCSYDCARAYKEINWEELEEFKGE